jgi:hypothetical protein
MYVPVHTQISFTYGVVPSLNRNNANNGCARDRRPGFDSRHYQKEKVLDLERGPLSLVSTTEELLDRKVAAPV